MPPEDPTRAPPKPHPGKSGHMGKKGFGNKILLLYDYVFNMSDNNLLNIIGLYTYWLHRLNFEVDFNDTFDNTSASVEEISNMGFGTVALSDCGQSTLLLFSKQTKICGKHKINKITKLNKNGFTAQVRRRRKKRKISDSLKFAFLMCIFSKYLKCTSSGC